MHPLYTVIIRLLGLCLALGQFSYAFAAKPQMPTSPNPGAFSSPGSMLTGANVSLSWNSVVNATEYRVNIRDMISNELVINNLAVSRNMYAVTLREGRSYRWNVTACRGSECSNATTALYFQIASPPPVKYNLGLSTKGNGSGSFLCDGKYCERAYVSGTITVNAIPDQGSSFVSWEGCPQPVANRCTFNLNTNRGLVAQFVKTTYNLAIAKMGNGTGNFLCNGNPCVASYPAGDVTIKANAAAGSSFVSWAGCTSMSGSSCVVSMIANRVVSATFNQTTAKYNLVLTTTGAGSGSFLCNSAICASAYPAGNVTVTANPASGSKFGAWSGCPQPNGNSCTVNLAANKNLSASFEKSGYSLSVAGAGNGKGSFLCNNLPCASYYSSGNVTVTALPAAGSSFGSWSGCTSNTNSCVVSMTANRSVSAFFNVATNKYTLTVNRSGAGSGSFTCNGTSCASSYVAGKITIIANPATGSSFGAWAGCPAPSGNTCTVNLNSNSAVSASFNIKDDHGNDTWAATLVKSGSTTVGNFETVGDYDYFRIDVATTASLETFTTGATDTYGYLLSSKGDILVENDDKAGVESSPTERNSNFRILRAVVPGTYFIKVRHQSLGTGAYNLIANIITLKSIQTRAVVLLHGLNSDPSTWNSLVNSRWSGDCEEVYAGRIKNLPKTPIEACYRVKFGSQDVKSNLAGLENVKCQNSYDGCKGDFTRIFNSGASDLGVEVTQAITAIRAQLGETVQITLLGHSRGGLAARAALQVASSSAALSSVMGLITTGTPHEGSPMGKIYAYLRDNCPRTNGKTDKLDSSCKDDWQGADTILGLEGNLDLRRPAIDFLSPISADIKVLASTVNNLKLRTLQIKKISYDGVRLGHLGEQYKSGIYFHYYVWDQKGGNVKDQFSDRSRRFILCNDLKTCTKTERDRDFLGDGIVPLLSQTSTAVGGVTVTYTTDDTLNKSQYNAYHTTEPSRVSDLNKALNSIIWK